MAALVMSRRFPVTVCHVEYSVTSMLFSYWYCVSQYDVGISEGSVLLVVAEPAICAF